ncbi:MAG: hypothetical protein ACRDQ7_11735 [Haloechinothrix sp.]
MFATNCPACAKRQLILSSQIKQLVNDQQGIVAIFTCWCGALGAERLSTVTARKRTAKPDLALAS